ncbi:uncharacterized protein LOC143511783 [Brachyhypopomus gauderio]|uniref:uncharacterized protein LOC143511783 n=1 Tax=Brachyhypopomus gauderio TaxID=698409 RepID=UPI004043296F
MIVLTHKTVFSSVNITRSTSPGNNAQQKRNRRSQGVWFKASPVNEKPLKRDRDKTAGESPLHPSETQVCFYCRHPGHIIADCALLNRKRDKPKEVACISASLVNTGRRPSDNCETFRPFILDGFIALSDTDKWRVPVQILRDTGAAQTLLSSKVLPLSRETFCGSYAVICGLHSTPVSVPLHNLYLHTELVTGPVRVAVWPTLPVNGVDVILGNDLAGGQVFPIPEVVVEPVSSDESDVLQQNFPEVFPVNVITRSQSKNKAEAVDFDLTDLFKEDKPHTKAVCNKARQREQDVFTCSLSPVLRITPLKITALGNGVILSVTG